MNLRKLKNIKTLKLYLNIFLPRVQTRPYQNTQMWCLAYIVPHKPSQCPHPALAAAACVRDFGEKKVNHLSSL